jgi:hypothetical protein
MGLNSSVRAFVKGIILMAFVENKISVSSVLNMLLNSIVKIGVSQAQYHECIACLTMNVHLPTHSTDGQR